MKTNTPAPTGEKGLIAEVFLSCGRQFLTVAGVVLALENDVCRDAAFGVPSPKFEGFSSTVWNPSELRKAAEAINVQAVYRPADEGQGQKVNPGSGMTDAEEDAFADRINEFYSDPANHNKALIQSRVPLPPVAPDTVKGKITGDFDELAEYLEEKMGEYFELTQGGDNDMLRKAGRDVIKALRTRPSEQTAKPLWDVEAVRQSVEYKELLSAEQEARAKAFLADCKPMRDIATTFPVLPEVFIKAMTAFAQSETSRLSAELTSVKYRWDTRLCGDCGYFYSPAGPCKCGQFAAPGSYERLHDELLALLRCEKAMLEVVNGANALIEKLSETMDVKISNSGRLLFGQELRDMYQAQVERFQAYLATLKGDKS